VPLKASTLARFEGGEKHRGKFNDALAANYNMVADFPDNRFKRIVPFAASDFLAWLLRAWSEKSTAGHWLRDNASRFVHPATRRYELALAAEQLAPDPVIQELVRVFPANSLYRLAWPSFERYCEREGYPKRNP
jgi:hypothetical protein